MNIDNITPLSFPEQHYKTTAILKQESSFSTWLSHQINQTNDQLQAADQALTELARGHGEQLHQTMITLEEAKLSFQYLEQIRNRLLSAYQELLREQI